jgi:hypothetical protein
MRRVTNPGLSGPAPRRPDVVPPPLHVAAALAGIEALFLIGIGVATLATTERERFAMALPTTGFFVLYGAGLMWSAWQLQRREGWARSFVVFAQLIQLGLAWNFVAESMVIATGIGLTALVVLAGVFHPQSLRALED